MVKSNNSSWVLIIPARLDSKRLPSKPLIKILGKTIIERTYSQALKAVKDKNKIIIATDSLEIKKHCDDINAKVCLTSKNCLTGTDRVAEVAKHIEVDQYINLQGDEPIFPVSELNEFINSVNVNNKFVYTAVKRITSKEEFFNSSIPKMVFTKSKNLLYSSRAPIPSNKQSSFSFGYKHICIYAFNRLHLEAFSQCIKKTTFEDEEDLEINRFLELDIRVKCIELKNSGKAVDNESDLIDVTKIISSNPSLY
ncbi:3-deoxy-manno-octulosonate cytidylyltransferase [Prochlorococcus marinus]|uniref:CMP-2-keto-3-deoxyoctulosonic acid synthetase n=1 Tax=Prochlorococcus marinus (strain MIT 9211) TaxID=93059 RepID=A9BBL6_PROM4|nr:3-deoxy-manno-octulosonate cytidylyltransferase [Prochlorococcus marinus]ABX09228.1 CMP-2-keto-3-deoxyoctulosonic acid synthetase [Prochlorococcus marinus str. MIT 9211]